MEKFLAGKTVIVTGGSRGIGRAIVGHLAELGAIVVFTYLQNRRLANELVETIVAQGGTARAIAADMAKPEDIDHLFASVMTTYGHLDVLINNAGVALYKHFEEFSEQDVNHIFDVNIKGVFLCCRHAARLMENNGSIINIGSTVTRVMLPTYGAYAASKGAVEQMSKVLAKELGGRGIRVNTVSPGPIDTELFRAGKTDEQIAQLATQAALGRIGTVNDVANLVNVLLDERSGWVTGQNILVNGGFAA